MPGLGQAVRLAVLSDLHFGWGRVDRAFAARVRRRVLAMAPDMVLFLGDLAGGWGRGAHPKRVEAGASALSGYDAPLGCYAILGNHEWKDDPVARARRAGPNQAHYLLHNAGWTVLENYAVDAGALWVAGIGSQRAFGQGVLRRGHVGMDDLSKALEPVPTGAPILLMAHEPDIFPDVPPQVSLTLSGHMHGGQIRPFGRALYAPSRFGTRYAYGRHESGPKQLIVSGGLGCSGVPLRYGIPPEITLVELTPQ